MSAGAGGRATFAAAAATLTFAGCGSQPPDLFVVQRSGQGAGARLSLVVSDGGTVRCNGGEARDLPSADLLEARDIARTLDEDLRKGRPGPPPGVRPIFRYRVRLPRGSVAFDDTSRPLPVVAQQLQALTRRSAKGVCGLAR